MKPFFSRHYELSDCVYRDANHGTPSFVRLNTDVKQKEIKKKKKSKQKLADVRVHLRNILKGRNISCTYLFSQYFDS